MRLTKRGKRVRALLILAGLLLVWWLMKETTPPPCRVRLEDMSQFCKDFLFPN